MKIKDIVSDQKIAYFDYYTDGNLWYHVEIPYTNNTVNWQFPIPIEDTKGAIFLKEHKAITLMRWIRKQLELIDSGA